MVNVNISEKLALNTIRQFQPLTIWELSKRMEISYSSAHRLTQELKRKDLIIIEKKESIIKKSILSIKEKQNE